MKIDNVIIKPVLTEKATQAAQNKTYTFEVSKTREQEPDRLRARIDLRSESESVRVIVEKRKSQTRRQTADIKRHA
jgi:ribosomal protein L23